MEMLSDCPRIGSVGEREKGKGERERGSSTEETESERVSRVRGPV